MEMTEADKKAAEEFSPEHASKVWQVEQHCFLAGIAYERNRVASLSDEEAAKAHAGSEGNNGNAELSFLQGCAYKDAEYAGLVKALRFYADERKWIPYHHALSGMDPEADIDGENGVRAREALKKFEGSR